MFDKLIDRNKWVSPHPFNKINFFKNILFSTYFSDKEMVSKNVLLKNYSQKHIAGDDIHMCIDTCVSIHTCE
jgi:hypothetical protein